MSGHGTNRTSSDVRYSGRDGVNSGRGADRPKSTRMTQSGHRPASHVAAAKPVSAPTKMLVLAVWMLSSGPGTGMKRRATRGGKETKARRPHVRRTNTGRGGLFRRFRPCDVAAGEADLLDVPVVGAAAAAQHVELTEIAPQRRDIARRVPPDCRRRGRSPRRARRGCAVEALARMPRTRLIQALVRRERLLEVRRVRAVDHVVGRARRSRHRPSRSPPSRSAPVGSRPSVSTVKEITTGIFAFTAARVTPIASSVLVMVKALTRSASVCANV